MNLYTIIPPQVPKVPILISSPHSGTYFPDEVKAQLTHEAVTNPDDTDWFIDQLYSFATEMGITMITANYSRWVVDLNRDPKSKPLYTDGRVITGLVTTTDFNGNSIYKDKTPDEVEIERRVNAYYTPYHQAIGKELQALKEEFGVALLFDAHSIRKNVPGIRNEAFPDLILGTNDGTSAAFKIRQAAWDSLEQDRFSTALNHPFKGGYITRSFGNPLENVHALQLEMAKTNYMDATETKYDKANAAATQHVLKNLFQNLIAEL